MWVCFFSVSDISVILSPGMLHNWGLLWKHRLIRMTSRQRPLKVAARVSQCFSSQKRVKNEPDTMQCNFFSGFLQQRHRGPLRAFRADMQSQNHALQKQHKNVCIYIYIHKMVATWCNFQAGLRAQPPGPSVHLSLGGWMVSTWRVGCTESSRFHGCYTSNLTL